MGRVKKTRVEGAEALRAIAIQGSAAELVAASGGTTFKAEAKPLVADPVPGDNGAALARIVDYFAASFPDEWEGLKLCPLKHGLETMIERLKA